MPVLVHLAAEKDARFIEKRGLRATRAPFRHVAYGVYCMPVLADFFVSHQWLRELKRRGQRTIVGVDFRLKDREIVHVGHYGEAHLQTTLGEAIRILREAADPRGYELVVPRSIAAKEILRTRAVPQVVGWRYFPAAKGRKPCPCAVCAKGEIKGARIWRPNNPPIPNPPRERLLADLRAADSSFRFGCSLRELATWGYRDAAAFEDLADSQDLGVREELAEELARFRGAAARRMLVKLAGDERCSVHEPATRSLRKIAPGEAELLLGDRAQQPHVRQILDEVWPDPQLEEDE